MENTRLAVTLIIIDLLLGYLDVRATRRLRKQLKEKGDTHDRY